MRTVAYQCSQDIVEEEDLSRRIHRASKGNSGFLSTAERKSLLTDLSCISGLEQAQIALQAALVDNFTTVRSRKKTSRSPRTFLIALLIVRRSEEDIFLFAPLSDKSLYSV